MTAIEQSRQGVRGYPATPYINLNANAAQDLRNLLGNFFTPKGYRTNMPAQYQQVPLQYNGNAGMIPAEAQRQAMEYLMPLGAGAAAIGAYALPQMTQNALLKSGTGTTLGDAASKTAYPLALFTASRFGAPAVNAVNRVANSPVGRWGAKIFDAIF